jgi:hypothetical protein
MLIKQGEYRTEQWMPVVGFQGYIVSNLGRVKSRMDGKFVQPWQTGKGVMLVRMTKPGGVNVTKKVARVVAEAFLHNPDGYAEVRHKDNDPTNCRVSNLLYIGDEETDLRNDRRERRHKERLPFNPGPVKKSLYVGLDDDDAPVKEETRVQTEAEYIQQGQTKPKRVRKKPPPKQRKRYGSVRVIQTGQVFPSVAEMSRQLGLDPSTVSAMLGGKRQAQHHGLSFEYENPRLHLPPEEKTKRRIMRPVRHIQTGKVYESQTHAAKDLDLVQSHISAQLRGLHKHVKGNTFEYADV